jgi:hypothetical protein
MEMRQRPRKPKRLTCEIEATDGRRSTGIVHDVSDRGLFVQTGIDVAPRSLVQISFPAHHIRAESRFEAGVARKRLVPRQLAPCIRPGLGLEIIPPWNEFQTWIRAALDETSSGLALGDTVPEIEPMVRSFRFRLIHHDRPRAQILAIRAETESGARAKALARAGREWKIASARAI